MKPFNKTILFQKVPIHVRYDKEGYVQWLSLSDLCRILQRNDKQDIENTARYLKSSAKFPIYTNGRLYWFIEVYDVQSLAKRVGKENKKIAKVCEELLEWAGALPVKAQSQHIRIINKLEKRKEEEISKKEESNDLILLHYQDRQISVKSDNGATYFNATEMARSFGKTPRDWLNLAETNRFRNSLIEQGKSENLENQVKTSRGAMGVTWIEQHLVMDFARWLSPEFSIWCNSKMEELLTTGMTVLNQPEEQVFSTSYGIQKQVPATYKEALLQIIEQEEYIEKQNQKIEEDRPKVEFYDDFIENRDSFKTSIIAEELRISTVHLYSFLREEKIVRWNGKYYEAYPNYKSLQVDHPYYWTYPKTGKLYQVGKTKRWSKIGREFVLDLYRNKHN
ncbi:KilA-N domain-containing protein [Bacteroides sp. 51]|uniref:KilA-N domain-containing protein n=1 Tax=Bacteroides sp. 51 TaxID=2302938 RepID=UPI0013D730B5|nr:KilA-N domain-containing protein [Bacteroides sp. 51]NDV80811.1 hypothetical protein [Bacteroides sp. 51]